MPSVLEAPETVEEEHVEQSYETLPPMSAPRPGVASTIITLLSGVAMYLRHRSHSEIANNRAQELPLDILAREHPYLCIQAMGQVSLPARSR